MEAIGARGVQAERATEWLTRSGLPPRRARRKERSESMQTGDGDRRETQTSRGSGANGGQSEAATGAATERRVSSEAARRGPPCPVGQFRRTSVAIAPFTAACDAHSCSSLLRCCTRTRRDLVHAERPTNFFDPAVRCSACHRAFVRRRVRACCEHANLTRFRCRVSARTTVSARRAAAAATAPSNQACRHSRAAFDAHIFVTDVSL